MTSQLCECGHRPNVHMRNQGECVTCFKDGTVNNCIAYRPSDGERCQAGVGAPDDIGGDEMTLSACGNRLPCDDHPAVETLNPRHEAMLGRPPTIGPKVVAKFSLTDKGKRASSALDTLTDSLEQPLPDGMRAVDSIATSGTEDICPVCSNGDDYCTCEPASPVGEHDDDQCFNVGLNEEGGMRACMIRRVVRASSDDKEGSPHSFFTRHPFTGPPADLRALVKGIWKDILAAEAVDDSPRYIEGLRDVVGKLEAVLQEQADA